MVPLIGQQRVRARIELYIDIMQCQEVRPPLPPIPLPLHLLSRCQKQPIANDNDASKICKNHSKNNWKHEAVIRPLRIIIVGTASSTTAMSKYSDAWRNFFVSQVMFVCLFQFRPYSSRWGTNSGRCRDIELGGRLCFRGTFISSIQALSLYSLLRALLMVNDLTLFNSLRYARGGVIYFLQYAW